MTRRMNHYTGKKHYFAKDSQEICACGNKYGRITKIREQVTCKHCINCLETGRWSRDHRICKSCGTRLISKGSRDKGVCFSCDQDVYIDEPDTNTCFKKCLRGHESNTSKNFCHHVVIAELDIGVYDDKGRPVCGQPMEVTW